MTFTWCIKVRMFNRIYRIFLILLIRCNGLCPGFNLLMDLAIFLSDTNGRIMCVACKATPGVNVQATPLDCRSVSQYLEEFCACLIYIISDGRWMVVHDHTGVSFYVWRSKLSARLESVSDSFRVIFASNLTPS